MKFRIRKKRNCELLVFLCGGSNIIYFPTGFEQSLLHVACSEDVHTTTACFSSDVCGFYKLECPSGHVIKIENLSYGWKTVKDPLCANISTTCTHSSLCCSYNNNDTLKDFTQYQTHSLYQQCSGKQRCSNVRATRTFSDSNVAGILSTYVVVKYTCSSGKYKDFSQLKDL